MTGDQAVPIGRLSPCLILGFNGLYMSFARLCAADWVLPRC